MHSFSPLFSSPASPPRRERGDVALNMGRGLGSGMSVGWTFKENWTLQPTIALGYSDVTGFQASLGGTVLRSFGWGHRVYGYAGAGIYYGSANSGYATTVGGTAPRPGSGETAARATTPYYATSNITYLTTPGGPAGAPARQLRGRSRKPPTSAPSPASSGRTRGASSRAMPTSASAPRSASPCGSSKPPQWAPPIA